MSTVSVYLLTKNSWQVLPHWLIDLSLRFKSFIPFPDTIHPISSSLPHSEWVSFMLFESSNWFMLGEIMKGSLIAYPLRLRTKFVLASLAPLINQLLYLQKFFVISCLWMQRVGKNKFFIFPWYGESICYFCERIWSARKQILETEYLA